MEEGQAHFHIQKGNDMNQVRPAAPQLADIEPYDPKYIPAEVMISANENASDVPF